MEFEHSKSPPSSVGVREHAALIGLLAERQVLIDNGALYVVFGRTPGNNWTVLQIDCGIILIALTKRLKDSVAAERALRDAIWIHLLNHRVDLAGKTPDDIEMGLAGVFLEKFKEQPKNWFLDFVASAYRVLHGSPDNLTTQEGAEMFDRIGGDVWRLYASTLTALGEQCGRNWPSN